MLMSCTNCWEGFYVLISDGDMSTTAHPNPSTTSAPEMWEENDMVWSSDQCPSIMWFEQVTLIECQDLCSSVSTCTAINYGESTGHCTLLDCGYPCPEPQWIVANYKGYCLNRGNFIKNILFWKTQKRNTILSDSWDLNHPYSSLKFMNLIE